MLLSDLFHGQSLLTAALLLSASAPAQLTFENRTADAGIDISLAHAADHPADIMDGGGTVLDANADGWPDLFIPSTGLYPERLFINQQNGSFADEAAAWGLTDLYRGVACTAADYDGNGYHDIYVTSMGDMASGPSAGQNRLYRNNGNGTFTEVAEQAGVSFTASVPDGFSSTFGDYDLDGDLDLYVTAWVVGSLGNRLFRNEGNGTFTDVTNESGVFHSGTRGFAPRFVDLNEDRYPELLLAADFGTSKLYLNQRKGVFRQVTGIMQPDLAHYGMGSAVGDFDGDLMIDWYITSIYLDVPGSAPNGNRLYLNGGMKVGMIAQPESAGVTDGGWGWGTVACDLDHDGHLDIVETNGWNKPEFVGERSYVFRNQGDATFQEISQSCNLNHVAQGRCLVNMDYDNDGDMDLVFFANQGPISLYRNDLNNADSNWLRVRLDTSGNPDLAPDGFGSRVFVRATLGGEDRWQVAYVNGGATYLGRSQLGAHFGLRDAQIIDEVRIQWANGFETVLTDVNPNQILTVQATRPFTQDPLVRGAMVNNMVSGVRPGERVYYAFSTTGTGPGPCIPQFGNECMDLSLPIYGLGSAVADAAGVANIPSVMPRATPLITFHTQAAVERGPDGLQSIKTNVISATVQP